VLLVDKGPLLSNVEFVGGSGRPDDADEAAKRLPSVRGRFGTCAESVEAVYRRRVCKIAFNILSRTITNTLHRA